MYFGIKSRLSLSICLVTLLCIEPYACQNNIEANLIKTLLKDYDVSARPIINKSRPIIVKVGLILQQIVSLAEREQQLTTKMWQRYEWQDQFLTWNPSDHGGIESIAIIPTRIWYPDITLYDDMSHDPNNNAAQLFASTVTYNGTVRWNTPKLIVSNCNVDVYAYPWDEQKCTLKFGSWIYDGAKLDVVNISTSGDLSYYTTSGEWSILAFDVKRNVMYYNCCPNPYPDVTFTIHIRRKVLYFIANLILPTVFITFTALLVFYLPAGSGEKVGLSVTVLLALIVFLLIIADSLPKSDSVPLIGSYYQSVIFLLSLSTSMTVVTLNIHHRGMFGKKVPAWVRKLVLNWMARVLCMKGTVDNNISQITSTRIQNMSGALKSNDEDIEVVSVRGTQNQEVNEQSVGNSIEQIVGKQNEDQQEDCERDWMLVAAVIDRLLMIVFFLLAIATIVAILCVRTQSDIEPIA